MNAARKFTIAAVLAPLACAAALSALGGELRPYSLPSQKAEPRYEQRPQEPRAVRPQISEAYYENFEKRVKSLKPAQRADLVRSFERKRDQAIASRRADEARHYLRLLQILEENR